MSEANMKKYNHKWMCTNITKLYQQVDEDEHMEGFHWYTLAHDFCHDLSKKYGINVDLIAGACAALSPGVAWPVNMRDTESLIKYHLNYQVHKSHSTYYPNFIKALRIIQGEKPLDVLGGEKTRNFYLNIPQ